MPSLVFWKYLPALVARLVLVDPHDLAQVVQLEANRAAHREVDEIVVEERHARLEAVRHAELVLDHQQAVQKGLGLEVQRVVDVVLGPVEFVVVV